ncbi:Ig-like domain-containing protein [Citricoccus sp.]|uniref:Ig-like domain-containing protein n=1 Tax=Citricoccus sp. TaxID=1978372 RepID=UPI0028BE47A0|nr:Ig-like domain-containing protein [Citricoccus sp.]
MARRGWTSIKVPVTFSAVGAVVATGAFLYPGFQTAELDLHDGGIWVTYDEGGYVGHLNYESTTLDGGLKPPVDHFDLHQQDGAVLMLDTASGALTGIDSSAMAVGDQLMMPATDGFALGGGVISASNPDEGTVFAGTVDPAPQISGEDPLYEGVGAVASTTTLEGQVLIADVHEGTVRRFERQDAAGAAFEETDQKGVDGLGEMSAPAMTAVGDVPVVVDSVTGRVSWPGHTVQDDRLLGAVPQPAGPASDRLALATGRSLLSMDLSSREVTSLALTDPADAGAGAGQPGGSAGTGGVTAPVQVNDCTHAASAQTGQYLRDCEGEGRDEIVPIPEFQAGSDLVFRVNRNRVVLNDTGAGTTWMVLEQMKVVSNWDDLEPPKGEGSEEDEESDEVTQQTVLPDRQDENRPPVATDDAFGVRAGRTTQLPVLFNDSDPDGDVLTARLDGDQPGVGTVQRILDGVGMQIVVPESASGSETITYIADDGRQGTDTAQVDLRVVPESENSAPTQERVPVLRVPAGESVTTQLLTDWLDPDGDDLQLTGAAADEPDAVRTRPDGQLTFQDNTGEPGAREIQVTVSDGRETTTGTAQIEVLERGGIQPPVTQADHVTVQAGQDATLQPLENDEDPLGGQLRLAYVSSEPELEVSYSTTAGTVQVSGATPNTYYLEYVAANEFDSAPGLIRVDVLPAEEDGGLPVAVRDTALLPDGGDVLVNVLGNDTDPAGGLLVVQGVEGFSGAGGESSPITVAVEEFNHVRVVDSGGLNGPATFTYRVANAQGTSTGEVTVVPLPSPEVLQPPVATADSATIRAGDIVTVDVLANDSHPNHGELTLEPDLVEAPGEGRGRAFVSDGMLRYRAGDEAGRVSVSYEVSGPDGQKASAPVEFTVTPMDRAANNPPVPPSVQARVLAGNAVTVPVNLNGTDPDGDSVTLVGVQSPPSQGSVRMEEGRLVYAATDSAAGTDTFTYQVVDRLGAIATGTVSVGIAQAPNMNHPPVALDDSVEVRPGRTFTTNVLVNDADPDGDPVALVEGGFQSSAPDAAVEIVDGLVRVTAPEQAGHMNLQYTVADPAGATDTGNLSIGIDPDAPLMPPVARDDAVGVEQIADQQQVAVPVLTNDEDPDGTVGDLEISLDPAAEAAGARVQADEVVVPVAQDAQTLMYTVTDVDGGTGHAFILIPGQDARAPWLTLEEPLEVMAGEPLRVDLTDHIGVRDGRTPQLTGDDAAAAAPASSRLDIGSATEVTFTSEPGYSGSASINVSVTDGESGGDPNGLVSTLSLPVSVIPRPDQNNPPTVQSSSLEVEQGGDPAVLDLAPLTRDPDGDDLALTLGAVSGEIAADVTGTVLTVTPSSNAERGTSGSVGFTVSDGATDPVPAEISVQVVGTSRPAPLALDDEVPEGRAGQPVTVDVLANDVNPFADEGPLTVTSATVTTGSGAAVTDGTTVTITPDTDYSGRMQVTYGIEDITGDSARQAQGTVTVVVKGVPGAPGVPRIEGVEDGEVSLSWAAPPDNGAPITGYTVIDTTTGATQACAATACAITGLANAVEHRFSVTAANEVGESEASGPSAPAVPDVRPEMPAAPTPVAGDGVVDLTWAAPENRGSAISSYRVQVSPALSGSATRTTGAGTSLRWDGLGNGVPYRFRIQAVNQAEEPSDWSAWSTDAVPAGKPFAPGTPSAVKDESVVHGGVVRVAWSAADDNGAALEGYTVRAHAGGSVAETRSVGPGTTSLDWSGLDKSTAYSFSVVATNGEGDSPASGSSASVTPFGRPGPISGLTTSATGTDRQLDLSFSGAASNGSPVSYEYSLGSGWSSLGTGTSSTITVPANGSSYSLTVRAKNAAGVGTSQKVSTARAYGPLKPPEPFTATGEGKVVFSWSTNTDAAGNGRDATMTATVNGRQIQNSGRYTSEWVREATRYTLKVTVCADGDCASSESSVSSITVPPPSIQFSLGAPFGDPEACGAGSAYQNCHYTVLNASGFEPNEYVSGGTCHGIRSDNGQVGTWEQGNVDFTVDGQGRLIDGNVGCWPHDLYSEAWIVVAGLESNHIRGPW